MSLENARKRLRSRYIDGLASRREALELLLASLYEDPEGTVDALRHEAMELRRSAQDYGFQQLARVAGGVEAAVPAELEARTRGLLEALDQATRPTDPEPLPVRRDVLEADDLRSHFALAVLDARRRDLPLSVLWVGTSDALAEQIRARLRDSDVVGRLEVGVVIVLPQTPLAGAGKLLARLEATGRVRALASPGLARPDETLDVLLTRVREAST